MISNGVNGLKERTQQFAIETIRFCAVLPKKQEFLVIGKQLIRSSSSVGANYRVPGKIQSRFYFKTIDS
jgi:hypothetical protein